jgi:hypothetical protein
MGVKLVCHPNGRTQIEREIEEKVQWRIFGSKRE